MVAFSEVAPSGGLDQPSRHVSSSPAIALQSSKHAMRKVKGKGSTAQAKKRRITVYGLFVLGATVLAYVVLIPRPVATIDETPPDPANPFSSPITVVNTGFLPLHNVSIGIAVQQIACDGTVPCGTLTGQPNYQTVLMPTMWVPRDMNMDDRFTIAFDQVLAAPPNHLGKADIAVVIEYELPVIHFGMTKRFPYYARKQASGFAWYSDAPHSDPAPAN